MFSIISIFILMINTSGISGKINISDATDSHDKKNRAKQTENSNNLLNDVGALSNAISNINEITTENNLSNEQETTTQEKRFYENQNKILDDIPSETFFNFGKQSKVGDSSKCFASGPGIEPNGVAVGKQTYFEIDATDAGNGQVEVAIIDTYDPIPYQIRPIGKGKFRVDYVAKHPGYHSINVLFAGKPIVSSPFNVNVSPGCDAKKCANGRGIKPKGIRLGDEANFEDAGEGVLKVSVKGPDGYELTVRCNNVNQTRTGPHQVIVTYGGDHMFNVNVSPGCDAKNCANGRGIKPKGIRLGDVANFEDAGEGVLKRNASEPSILQNEDFQFVIYPILLLHSNNCSSEQLSAAYESLKIFGFNKQISIDCLLNIKKASQYIIPFFTFCSIIIHLKSKKEDKLYCFTYIGSFAIAFLVGRYCFCGNSTDKLYTSLFSGFISSKTIPKIINFFNLKLFARK